MNGQTTKRAGIIKSPETTLRETGLPFKEDRALAAARAQRRGPARKDSRRPSESKARQRMLSILDIATALVAMADQCGGLFYLNAAGHVMLGIAREDEICGIALIECVAPAARARMTEQAIPAAMRNGVWSGDSVLMANGGRHVDVSLVMTAHYGEDDRVEGISIIAQDISAWTSAEEALRITQNELLRLSAQHLVIQEAERKRIAADLHDGLGQSLSLVNVTVEAASSLLGAGKVEKAAACLDRLKPKVRELVEEVRGIAMNLRPATLDSLGILATLSWYFREFDAAWPKVNLEREICIEEADIPGFLKTPIFRILQEAGSNAIKHARADRIKVCLVKRLNDIELCIEDNGTGFDPAEVAAQSGLYKGMGLQSMRERAALSCGIYELQSLPGRGTRICVRWPLSLNELEIERAAAPDGRIRAIHDLGSGELESARDLNMLHNLSVCVACIRSIKNNG